MEIPTKYQIMKFRKWMTFVMKKIIENYGPGRELIDPTVHDDIIYQNGDASTIYLNLKLAATDSCEAKCEPVIVKRPIKNIKYHKRSRWLLYNEVAFYQNYSHPYDNIPKCYYANRVSSKNPVIVLQSIEQYGYYSYLQKHPRAYVPHLDSLDGTILAVREIARFHSKGYIMKEFQTYIFHTTASRFRNNWLEQINDCHIFFKLLGVKMAGFLLSDIDKSISKKVENIFSMAPQIFRNMLCQEPLSTICHGNLKLSNIFFNSSNIDRQVMLHNFEFVMYAPAVIDLAMYITLCCTDSEICWFHNILEAYCFELHGCLTQAGIQDLEKYSFDVFWGEYQKYAIGGLVIACLYLPKIIGQVEEDALNEMNHQDYINFIEMDGQNEICKALTYIIMQLDAVGCLNNYQEII